MDIDEKKGWLVSETQQLLFFLEYAGELRTFVLREEKTAPYKDHHLTPGQAVRGEKKQVRELTRREKKNTLSLDRKGQARNTYTHTRSNSYHE